VCSSYAVGTKGTALSLATSSLAIYSSRRLSTSLPIAPGEQQIMSNRYDRATGRVAWITGSHKDGIPAELLHYTLGWRSSFLHGGRGKRERQPTQRRIGPRYLERKKGGSTNQKIYGKISFPWKNTGKYIVFLVCSNPTQKGSPLMAHQATPQLAVSGGGNICTSMGCR
jgi:hypothetical protein